VSGYDYPKHVWILIFFVSGASAHFLSQLWSRISVAQVSEHSCSYLFVHLSNDVVISVVMKPSSVDDDKQFSSEALHSGPDQTSCNAANPYDPNSAAEKKEEGQGGQKSRGGHPKDESSSPTETPYDLNMVAEHLQPIHKASAYAEGAKNLAALTQHTSPQIDAVAEDIEAEVEEMMGEDAKKQKVSIEGGTILERLDIIEKSLGDSAAVSTMNQKLDLLTLLVQQLVGRSQQSLAPRRSDVTSVVSGTEPETMEEAADSKVWISGRLVKWFPEKAFGFISSKGVDVFVHSSAILGDPCGILGQAVMCQVITDPHRGDRFYKAVAVVREVEHQAELARKRAADMAAEGIRAAEATRHAIEVAELAAMREKRNAPPGLAAQAVPQQYTNQQRTTFDPWAEAAKKVPPAKASGACTAWAG